MNGNHTTLKSIFLDVDRPIERRGIVLLWENHRYHFAATKQGSPKEVADALRMLADQIQGDAAFGLMDKLIGGNHARVD